MGLGEATAPTSELLPRPSHVSTQGAVSEGRAGLRVGWVLLAIAVAVFCIHFATYHAYVLDDTYISLRYARNLVEGHGLIFNPGERVEGYTNFSFVLLAALFLKLGIEPLGAMKWLLLAAGGATLWLMTRIERLGCARAGCRGAPLSLVFLLPLQAFAYWVSCPMETALFTGLFTGTVYLTLRESETGRFRGAVLAALLMALTRPEGVYVFAVVAFFSVVAEWLRGNGFRHWRRQALNVSGFTVVFAAYFSWRLWYYGDWFPNTYYAKVTGGAGQLATGIVYFKEWATSFPFLAAAPAFPLIFASRAARRLLSVVPALSVYFCVIGYVAYVVAVGGDFMPFFRFFLPVMPLMCVLLAWTLRALLWPAPVERGVAEAAGSGQAEAACGQQPVQRALRRPAVVLACLFFAHVTAALLTEQPYRAFVAHRTALVGAEVGKWFAARLAPDDLMAVNTVGSLPYISRRPTIDMLGLTDAAIAHRPIFIISEGWAGHRRGWGKYVLGRRPRVILWYNSAGSDDPFYFGDHELADDPLFRFFYRLKAVTLPQLDGAVAAERPLERFLGFPFGFAPAGEAPMGDLGLRVRFHRGLPDTTTFFEGPIRLTYFEFDRRDDGLWNPARRLDARPEALVRFAADRWAAERPGRPPPDRRARAEVNALCARAQKLIRSGKYAHAKQVLADASRRNRRARSALVYQYVANLAVMTGEPFVAVGAQKEALRLEPGNALYRKNLVSLLTIPYKKASHRLVARRFTPPTIRGKHESRRRR